MLWDCKFCGTQKLLGVTHRHCPNCGAPQDPTRRYFPKEEDMVAVANPKYVGADKICPACSQPNSGDSTFCIACGADLATGKVAELQTERVIGTGIAESETRQDVTKAQFDAEMARVKKEKAQKPVLLGLRKKELILISGVILLALCVVAVVFAVTYRKTTTGTISALTWERTIDIQDFQPRADSGWHETVPGDAYNRSCSERQRSTRRVPSGSHQECKDVDQGNGSFKRECHTVTDYRSEPVYDQWCSYTVDRWAYKRSVKASGQGKVPPPTWPTFILSTGNGRYGGEQESTHHEKYTVTIRDKDKKTHDCSYDETKWTTFDVGQSVTLKLRLGGSADCSTLKLTGK